MRIRRKTWARPELAACPYYIPQPEAQKGRWQEVFSSPRPIHLDLGCGKCVFLAQAAHTHRDVNFIGIDISLDILGVARRNIQEAYGEEQPDNVALCAYNIERLPQLFAPGEQVERIYINFCNPWPAAGHHKRRLTHTRQLLSYKPLLAPGGEIWFKTVPGHPALSHRGGLRNLLRHQGPPPGERPGEPPHRARGALHPRGHPHQGVAGEVVLITRCACPKSRLSHGEAAFPLTAL